MKIDRSWIDSSTIPTKINKKNVMIIEENGKFTIKLQLLRSMSVRLEQGERSVTFKEEVKEDDTIRITSDMGRMSFGPT